MLKHVDRLMILGYFKAYLVCLVSLLSLYVVIDMFTNLDDFTQHYNGFGPFLRHIGQYYGFRLVQIFDRLCEAIVLLAAMFTVAWMQRNNELLPLLSAGISTRRVVMPVLVGAWFMLSLTTLNQELLIPRVAANLLQDRDDPDGKKDIDAHGVYEPNNVHIEGRYASRKHNLVRNFNVVLPESLAGSLLPLTAKEARYIPPSADPHSGGWLLTDAQPPVLDHWDNPAVLEMLDPGKYFLHTTEVDFESLTRKRNWYQLASTLHLRQELQRPESNRLAPMAVLFHMRLTRPILGMILVLLGLSVILRDQNRNIFISAGLCLILCGVFFGACFACKSLGENEFFSPALAAWLPVLAFGPVGLVLFDAVHT